MTTTAPSPLGIIHVCSIKGRGGTGYMAGHILRLLHEGGHRVFAAPCAGSKVEERAKEQGVPVLSGLQLRRGFRPSALWHDVCLLRRWIREHEIDILHAWHSIEYWTCFLASLGTRARLARTRGLVTPIAGHPFNRMIHNRTAALFSTCSMIRQRYREAGFSEANIFDLHDGVDTARFKPGIDGSRIRKEAGIPADAFVIGSVGRLEAVKDQRTLLAALKHLPDDCHALFAGGGSLHEELTAQAEREGTAARAHFLGVRSDIPDVLAASSVYALCSIGSEGSSRATLEAMAAGLPCVTTGVGMLPDIVRHEETGLRFDAGDAEGLAAQLRRLYDDSALRERIAATGMAMARNDHSEEAMLRSVENAYRRALGDGA